ncbi:MAG: hypothetical protein HN731_02485 [Rhodospirillaceae bacterium]|nr:hypothetical protein [Rhodospirillaceae bacterium]
MSVWSRVENSKIKAALGVLVLALLLTACDDTSNVTPGFTRGEIARSAVIRANSKGPILIEIFGDPFGMRDSVLAEKIIAALDGHFASPVLRFTTDDDEAYTPNVRYRIAFGWPVSADAKELCDKDIPDISPKLEKITVAGALCFDKERLIDAEGWVKGVKTPDDLKFKTLMSDLARNILDRDTE